ncbi:MAG: VOC family protein [Elusimicrobiota bacterium]
MAAQNNVHHSIDYIEINVSNLEKAKAFYGAAFGWKFNDYGPDYAGIQKGGGQEAGGLRQVANAAPGGSPLVVLFSNNLDASMKSVIAAGGSISTPPFSFPGGRRFHFKDLSGNELAVWSHK